MSLGKRFFAWILKMGDSANQRIYSPIKKNIFAGVQGTVIEIGPGTGVNFSYLPSHFTWIGVEPNAAFHSMLNERAAKKSISVQLISGDATTIPVQDNTADFLICTLVLCSVPDPIKALAEIKRVLKPGGKLIFIEHVAAPENSNLRKYQNFFNPMNRAFADGCNCNRETWKFIESAGFSKLEISHMNMKGTMPLHKPHIAGYAMK